MDQAYQLRKIVSMLKENRLTGEKERNRIVTITSGKGGVGKTTFTVNLALSLREKGFRVLIIDADFGLSNVNIVLGISVKYDLSHVLKKEKAINEVIAEGPNGIKFISGGNGIPELLNLSMENIEEYVKQLMELQDVADIILVDTGAGVNDHVLKFVLSSDEVILLTTPEPTALMDAYALTKTASKINHDVQIRLVVNMAQSVEEGENTLKSFKSLAKSYLGMNVDCLGYMLYDKAVTEAIRQQVPFLTNSPKCAISKNIQSITLNFVNQPGEKFYKNNLQRFLNRLIGKRNR